MWDTYCTFSDWKEVMDSIDDEQDMHLDVAQLVERLTVAVRPLGLLSDQPAIGSIPIVEIAETILAFWPLGQGLGVLTFW